MRTVTKIVLIIIIITLLYSVAKLISANSTKAHQITIKTAPIKLNNQSMQTNQKQKVQTSQTTATATPAVTNAQTSNAAQSTQQVPPTPDTPNAQGLYQADEILIDGQGKAGSNYIDITSDTPITPELQNNTQSNTQNNNYNNSGAYVETSVNINNDTNANTSEQTYAPGVPAFEVFDGN